MAISGKRTGRAVALEGLRTLVRETGLAGIPDVDGAVLELARSATLDQLAAVSRLLEKSLVVTHRLGHLPAARAWQAIRDLHTTPAESPTPPPWQWTASVRLLGIEGKGPTEYADFVGQKGWLEPGGFPRELGFRPDSGPLSKRTVPLAGGVVVEDVSRPGVIDLRVTTTVGTVFVFRRI